MLKYFTNIIFSQNKTKIINVSSIWIDIFEQIGNLSLSLE